MTIPPSYFGILANIESSSKLYAKANTSSASGLYQMIKAVWIAEGGAWGKNPLKAFGGLFPSGTEQTQRIRSLTEKNAAYLAHAGIPITNASLYAAHFLGPSTAARILGAPDGDMASKYAGAAATLANPTVLARKTVGSFKAWLNSKTGG